MILAGNVVEVIPLFNVPVKHEEGLGPDSTWKVRWMEEGIFSLLDSRWHLNSSTLLGDNSHLWLSLSSINVEHLC